MLMGNTKGKLICEGAVSGGTEVGVDVADFSASGRPCVCVCVSVSVCMSVRLLQDLGSTPARV